MSVLSVIHRLGHGVGRVKLCLRWKSLNERGLGCRESNGREMPDSHVAVPEATYLSTRTMPPPEVK